MGRFMLRNENKMATRIYEVTFPDKLDEEYISNLVKCQIMDLGPDVLVRDITVDTDNERTKDIYDYYGTEKFWESLSETEQIQVAAVIFRRLVDHAQINSSFRCLLYNEFGWNSEAYSAIYAAGGMAIHNLVSGAMVEEKEISKCLKN